MSDKKLTTGESYGRLFKELVTNGVPDDVAGAIVRNAAIDEINVQGYTIRGEVQA